MAVLLLILIAWGALAFGAVYEWAYGGLLAASVPVALLGLLRPTSRVRRRVDVAVLLALLLVAGTVSAQLISLDRETLLRLSPGTDEFLREYDVGYALRVVMKTRVEQTAGSSGLRQGSGESAGVPAKVEVPATQHGITIEHPISINPEKTRLGLVLFAAFGLLLLGLTRGLDGHDLRALAAGLTVLGVLMSLVGIIQLAVWNGRIYGFWTPEQSAFTAFGPFVNRNHFAGWMLMVLPVVVGLFASQVAKGMRGVGRGWRSRVLWFSTPDANRAVLTGFSLLVMGLALVMTLSRSGIACLLLAVTLSALNVLRRQTTTTKQRLLASYLVAVFIAAVMWTGVDAIGARFSKVNWELGGRAGAWTDAWRIHEQFPAFGTGLNTYGTATTLLQEYEVGQAHYSAAHNDYLQILVEGGYVVGVPALILLAIVFNRIRARFAEAHDDRTGYWLRVGAVTGLVAIGFQEVVEFSLQMPGNAFMFTVLCAMAMRRVTPKTGPGARGQGTTAGRGAWLFAAVLLASTFAVSACGEKTDDPSRQGVEAVYSKATGKLELLTYDSNKDGRVDMWSHMAGTRLLRIEIDRDFDGVIDRWEYFSADGRLDKVGMSRQKDGIVDTWAFQAPDGTVGLVEVSTKRDGRVSRWEHLEKGALLSAEEDADGDGRPDRWETYQNGSLASLSLDTLGRGRPDRKLIYGPGGVTVEKLE